MNIRTRAKHIFFVAILALGVYAGIAAPASPASALGRIQTSGDIMPPPRLK